MAQGERGHPRSVDPALWAMVMEAFRRQREQASLRDADSPYPPPLQLGPQAEQSSRLWADDPRKYLPRQKQPDKLNRREDPEHMRALQSMIDRPIPGTS